MDLVSQLYNTKILIEENLFEKFQYFPRTLSREDFVIQEDVIVVDGNVPSSNVNIICVIAAETKESQKKLDDTLSYFRSKNQPVSVWAGPSCQSQDLSHLLEGHGFVKKQDSEGMFLDLRKDLDLEDEGILDIVRVLEKEQIKDFTAVLSTHDQQWSQYLEKLLQVTLEEKDKMGLYVGYLNNEPLSIASLFYTRKVAGIYDIMTLPSQGGVRIQMAMLKALMHEARERFHLLCAVLSLSQQEKLRYETLGFQGICGFSSYHFDPQKNDPSMN